jgi:nitrogen fixation NifU-like protein
MIKKTPVKKTTKKKEDDSLYGSKVMDYFMNPRNVGEIKNPDGVGVVGNPVCGDIMKMYLRIKNDKVIDAKFQTFGCGAAIATSSMATELIKGKSVADALKISNRAVAESLEGLPAIKMHCSVLAEEAIKAAIEDYKKKLKIMPMKKTTLKNKKK